jgi:hypothetical protein
VTAGLRLTQDAALRTAAGAAVTLQLGSDVGLNVDAGTSVVLADRAIDLERGRVFASVAPGGHGFVVHTGHADASVVGTRFAVECRADASILSVVEGHVAFGNAHGAVAVEAGCQSTASAAAPPRKPVAADLLPAVAWAGVGPSQLVRPAGVARQVALDVAPQSGDAPPPLTGTTATVPLPVPKDQSPPLLVNGVLTADGQRLPNPVHGTVGSYAAGVLTLKPAARDAAPGSWAVPVGTDAVCWSLRQAELKDFTRGRLILVLGVEPSKLAQDPAKGILVAPLDTGSAVESLQGAMPGARGWLFGAIVQRAGPEQIEAVVGGPLMTAGMPDPDTPLTIRINPATVLALAERIGLDGLGSGRLVHVGRGVLSGKHSVVQLLEGAEPPPDGPENASWQPLWVDGLVTAASPQELTLLRCDVIGEVNGAPVVRLPLDVPLPCHFSLLEEAVKPGLGDEVLAYGQAHADGRKLVASRILVQPMPEGDDPLQSVRRAVMMNALGFPPRAPGSGILAGRVLSLQPLAVDPRFWTGPAPPTQGGGELEFAPDCTRYALTWEAAPRFTVGSRVIYGEVCAPRQEAGQPVTVGSAFVQFAPPKPVTSSFDERGRLVVDGKPLFALGVTALPWDAIDWAEARAAGFRLAVIGFSGYPLVGILDQLDQARQAEMQVIVDTSVLFDRHPQLAHNVGPWTSVSDMVAGQLVVIRRHPAVIGWQIWQMDWRADDRPEEWAERYAQFMKADPDHICVAKSDGARSSHAGVAEERCDVALSLFGDPDAHRCVQGAPWALQNVMTQLKGVVPVWAEIQASDIGLWEPATHPSTRGPTLQEMRNATFSSLATGANGLLFYNWTHLKADRRGFHTRLAEVQQVVGEVKALEPFLISDESPPPIRFTLRQGGQAYVRSWQNQGEALVVAANVSDAEAANIDWSLPAGASDPQAVAGEADQVGVTGARLLPLQAAAVKLRLR